jgi:hypothetical protein
MAMTMNGVGTEVMKKVRTIFLLRRLAAPFVIFIASVAIIVSTVSVSNVLSNMPDLVDIQAVARFFVAAFAHTDIVIKSALVAGFVFLVLTLRGLIETKRLSVSLGSA